MRDNSALHFVGETIDAKQAHLRAQAGGLVRLVRGVYADPAVDVDALVLGRAVRIARYLYPSAYLSSASAVLLGPTRDGRLFVSGRRNQRTRLRTLEIVQNEAPEHPSTTEVIVGDDMGELRVQASSLRQRFLEAFRLRSEHAGAITAEMRAQIAARLIEEYGSPQEAADALWALARENAWYREGEGAERYLSRGRETERAMTNPAALDLVVAWHGVPLGRLRHDGFEWRWQPSARAVPPLIRETRPGKLPAFIESLLPEGWLARVLQQRDERDALRQGRRYMSNIAVVAGPNELETLALDVLQGRLERYSRAGRFTGRYAGPGRQDIERSFEQNLARLFASAETPRLSGVQIKAPMFLDARGVLQPATERPFTHILKPAGTAGFEQLPVVEWLCMEIARAVGFEVPAAALVAMPNAMPPALVVERFDLRTTSADRRRFALEDFCSLLDLPSAAKYDGTIERMAKALRSISTDAAADLELLLRRALFAWLIADGDMHLKNVAVLRVATPRSRRFASVRLAPLYDAVTTRVFPGLARDRMGLKLNGKDDRLAPKDFLALARTMDLPIARAEAILSQTAERMTHALPRIRLPAFAASDEANAMHEKLETIISSRLRPFG